ncbi:hypothetical protein L3X38_042529 [Prunus dulcis]|uniref:Reverse transcriptase/retrotransposon-derived protein RNase H-like domain-containing protein n=1 Tax=Prunus dulcis TaxID=3755 RepID=A0AAD4UV28_PRUDU|nr:hypothetical protein L3X38_042529 [Prunus dulcis]
MSRAPLLSKPLQGEVLFLYLSVSSTTVSSVLICKLEKAELPIFYVSKALQNAEIRYPPLEQLALAFFKPRPAEKGQAIADFISELTPSVAPEPANSKVDDREPSKQNAKHFNTSVLVWILHVDGLANQQGCGAGLVLTTPDKAKVEYALRFNFRISNNEAEHKALLAGIRLAKSMSAK